VSSKCLLRLAAGDGRDARHEVEAALRRAAIFGDDALEDLRSLRFREAALTENGGAVIVAARGDVLARRADGFDEGSGRGVGKVGKQLQRSR